MLSIDEAITLERQIAKDQIDRMPSFEHEQIANWLEELKELKENSISKEAFEKMKSKAYQYGYRQGYAKAIDDFAKFANTMPTVETEDGTIRPMWLEEMAERLKEQNNEQWKQSQPNRND